MSHWYDKVDKYYVSVKGEIAVGNAVTVKTEDGRFTGEVIYIHPENRYFQIMANGFRESFWFPFGEATNKR